MKLKNLLAFLTDRRARLTILANRGLLWWVPDEKYLRRAFRIRMGRPLDLTAPKTYTEKLQWLKLHDRDPLHTRLVDKYAVRSYVADAIGEEYLIPLVGGPWASFDEIDFDALPEQFVLKCTHDSGGLIVCRDKAALDRKAARRKITRSLKRDYYTANREWPYRDVPRRIIAEKYVEDSQSRALNDYKFFCFHGDAKLLLIVTDRFTPGEKMKLDFFDMDLHHLDLRNGYPNAAVPPAPPEQFPLMRRLAGRLSEGLPHARIDLYEADGRVYFGEITLFHGSGLIRLDPPEWDRQMGDWIRL